MCLIFDRGIFLRTEVNNTTKCTIKTDALLLPLSPNYSTFLKNMDSNINILKQSMFLLCILVKIVVVANRFNLTEMCDKLPSNCLLFLN